MILCQSEPLSNSAMSPFPVRISEGAFRPESSARTPDVIESHLVSSSRTGTSILRTKEYHSQHQAILCLREANRKWFRGSHLLILTNENCYSSRITYKHFGFLKSIDYVLIHAAVSAYSHLYHLAYINLPLLLDFHDELNIIGSMGP